MIYLIEYVWFIIKYEHNLNYSHDIWDRNYSVFIRKVNFRNNKTETFDSESVESKDLWDCMINFISHTEIPVVFININLLMENDVITNGQQYVFWALISFWDTLERWLRWEHYYLITKQNKRHKLVRYTYSSCGMFQLAKPRRLLSTWLSLLEEWCLLALCELFMSSSVPSEFMSTLHLSLCPSFKDFASKIGRQASNVGNKKKNSFEFI